MSIAPLVDPGSDRDPAVTVMLPGPVEVRLRPLHHGEHEPVEAVLSELSPESRASRYLTGMDRLPPSMLRALTDVDGHRHIAWVAHAGPRPVGIARTVVVHAGTAEVAVEVVDDLHGLGLGTALVDAVTTVAAARGVHRLSATLAPDNEPSRRLVTRLGVRLCVVDGLLEGEGPLRLVSPPRVDRRAVLELATPPQQHLNALAGR